MYIPTEQDKEAIKILSDEVSDWQDGAVWITDKVGFNMLNIVKKARKNYFGIFNEEYDPTTGRKKIFIPMTEWVVDTILKNIDIDTENISAKAKHPKSYKIAQLFRDVLKNKLDLVNFGHILNLLLHKTCIDGTGFLKAWKEDGLLQIKIVDRMNIIFDPSSETLDDSSAIIERNILTLPEFKEYNWDNGEFVEGDKEMDRTGFDLNQDDYVNTSVPYVEVYERYGYFPKFLITGKDKDKKEYVYGLIIASGIGDTPIIHQIKEVKEHPYQEFKLKDVMNRLDGRGIPEMLFSIQAYLNETVNTRLNLARIVQRGLWKIRGAVTPQQLKRLFTTSGIKLRNTDDIERLDTGNIDPSTYKDEEQAYIWGTRVTGTTHDDEVAVNRPATNAIIQQQGTSKGYNLKMEGLLLQLEKFLKDKVVPIIKQTLKDEEIIRITGDPQSLEDAEDSFVRNLVYQKLAENPTLAYSNEEVEQAVEAIKLERAKMGEDRWLEIKKDLFNTEFDIKIVITNEQINKAVITQTLLNLFKILNSVGLPIKDTLKELFDTIGLDAEKLTKETPTMPTPVPSNNVDTKLPAGVGTVPKPV